MTLEEIKRIDRDFILPQRQLARLDAIHIISGWQQKRTHIYLGSR